MKRFHVHVAVDNLENAIRFYSNLFGGKPSVVKPDYAKWMLDDPRINFAISNRGHAVGVNHLGFQLDSDDEFKAMRGQLEAADSALVEQTGAACCYARSDKYWVTDPAGVPWETFHSLESVPVFGEDTRSKAASVPCCVPVRAVAGRKDEKSCCG
ncbi:MAG TPA: ArsI/CadI family heavy metal resistance metalloenzyme [Burkholderiales bacterium]|nr:ArsI/CadI family heavy metal resistance metalloenzyme [Burkholderiales bacterium]